MKMGRFGAWIATNSLSGDQLAGLVRGLERLGYDTLWYPESLSYESLSIGGFLLSRSERLFVASGIANIYARDAFAAMAGYNSLNALYEGRFVLGLGVSHKPLVTGRRGHDYGRPVSTMRAYLEGMESAKINLVASERNVMLAALGPKMLELSRDMTQGALPYCVTPDHTAMAKKILGPERCLCVEQKICLTKNESVARKIASKGMAPYLVLENYRNNWLRIGFNEGDLEEGGSERFLDSMVLWGSEDKIRKGLRAHLDAGATHIAIQPLDPGGASIPDWNALTAFAPESWS